MSSPIDKVLNKVPVVDNSGLPPQIKAPGLGQQKPITAASIDAPVSLPEVDLKVATEDSIMMDLNKDTSATTSTAPAKQPVEKGGQLGDKELLATMLAGKSKEELIKLITIATATLPPGQSDVRAVNPKYDPTKFVQVVQRGSKEFKLVPVEQLTEEAVMDFSVQLQARRIDAPDYLNITLADSSMIPRWVNTNSVRLGQMRAMGYRYVTQADLAKNLEMEIDVDSSGRFIYGDLVAMMCSKVIYFSALRHNAIRALRAVNPTLAAEAGVAAANQFMQDPTSYSEEQDGYKGDYNAYNDRANKGHVKFEQIAVK